MVGDGLHRIEQDQLERGKTKVELLPLKLKGNVVHGFGRGSKQLGCPTANIPIQPYEGLLKQLPLGVYTAFASVAKGPIYKAAVNIGWSPYYQNTEKTLEVHLLHKFESDFYGEELRVVIMSYVRPEANFSSLDALIKAIQDDITFAEKYLDSYKNELNNPFLLWISD